MSARSPPGGMDGCRSSAPIRLPPGTAPAGPVYLAPRLVYLSSPSRRGSMVGVAQSVRAPDCGSGGRRFDPGRPPSSRPRSGRQWQTRVRSRNAVDTPRGFRYCEGLPCFCRSTAGPGTAAHPLGGNAASRVPERLRLRGVQPHRCLTIEVMRSGRALPPKSTVSLRFRPVEDDPSRRAKGSTNTDSEQGIRRDPLFNRAVQAIQIMESLILAQDERWRRALYMQVERGPGACTWSRVADG